MRKSNELLDKRVEYRLNRIEKEKSKQKKKHQYKIENTDFLSKLNSKKEEDNGH